MKRRSFLQLALSLPMVRPLLASGVNARKGVAGKEVPVVRSGEGPFSGDEFSFVHQYLRDGTPVPEAVDPPDRVRDVLIVGGGPSGLIAGWMLRDRDILVLEKDRLAGGTSKMETWRGIPYALGAAYVTVPEKGSKIRAFYEELGLDKDWRLFGDAEMGVYEGTKYEAAYWERPDTKAIGHQLAKMNKDRYPEIPFPTHTEEWTKDEIRAIDAQSWAQLLRTGIPVKRGAKPLQLPPHVVKFLDLYSRPVFGATSEEVSAWASLNQFLSEFSPMAAWPGGNGFASERIAQRLSEKKPGCIKVSSPVLKIEVVDGLVKATAVTPDGTAHVYRAKTLIFAGPKFIAARCIADLPRDQREAISEIRYRPYLVANVLLKRQLMDRKFYDGYVTGLGDSEASDVTLADYAARATGPPQVLTYYIPLARDNGRIDLVIDTNISRFREQVLKDMSITFASKKFTPADVEDIRFTRWGHPMIYPKPGQLTSGIFETASRPFGPIAFAHQDNLGNPCMESCFDAASDAVTKVLELLGRTAKR